MNTKPIDTVRLALQHDRAKVCANRLRDEAIDDFWRGADAVLRRGLHSGYGLLVRSGQRLQNRLLRRWAGARSALLEG